MIWKNFVRDLRRTASRLISVSIITMIAVMVYTALSGILHQYRAHLRLLSGGAECGGLLAHRRQSGQGDCRTLEGIAGVTGCSPG